MYCATPSESNQFITFPGLVQLGTTRERPSCNTVAIPVTGQKVHQQPFSPNQRTTIIRPQYVLAWSRLYLNVTGHVSEMLPYCKYALQVRELKKLIISAYTQFVLSTLMNLCFQTYL